MLHLATDAFPLGFPGSEDESVYLKERIQHGWDLITILATGLEFTYYWKSYDGSPTSRMDRSIIVP